MLPIYSPYRGLAGVGVAYVLAISTALNLDKLQGMVAPLLELYTLGTIADLAPLVGVNRRWLKRGLRQLPQSHLPGVQALMQVAGVNDQQKNLKPEDIGFRLGPRINAIGRLADPQIVIDLLTTNDMGLALQRAMQCEEINRQRQNLCTEIEEQAIALIENTPILWQQSRVLVMVQSHWHHGVIGIVASRLKDRYGVPVFLATYEETNNNIIRGSARGIEEFNVFESLQFCQDLLGKFGGHPAAGGFSLPAENWLAFQERLSVFAYQCLEPAHLKPLVKIDAQASFKQLDFSLYHEIDSLQPWGIGNDEPVFWTPKVRLREQRIISKKHLKLILKQDGENSREMEAIAWGWAEYFPLPTPLDIAYKLQENNSNGDKNLQLELVAVRYSQQAIFSYQNHTYSCHVVLNQLIITNDKQGEIITVNRGEKLGVLTNMSNNSTQSVDVTQRFYYDLIKSALTAIQQ